MSSGRAVDKPGKEWSAARWGCAIAGTVGCVVIVAGVKMVYEVQEYWKVVGTVGGANEFIQREVLDGQPLGTRDAVRIKAEVMQRWRSGVGCGEIVDAWGNPMSIGVEVKDGTALLTIISSGRDEKMGTGDDLEMEYLVPVPSICTTQSVG